MNFVTLNAYYKDMQILDAKIQELDAKLNKALKIMAKVLKGIKENEKLLYKGSHK